MKILIISGFLGAGKTTFIKALAKRTGKEFAILENEYGAVGVDGDRLKGSMTAGNVNIWEMAEGCICCSVKGDFAASVLTIANSVDPEYLVIEPTGVGVLGNIISNLRKIEYERISLLAPVTMVDFHSFDRYSQNFPDLYQEQIAFAHTVIVSKAEQAGAEEKDALKKKLEKWNPDGNIITEHYSTLNKEWYLGLLERGFDGKILESRQSGWEKLPDSFSLQKAFIDCPEKLFVLMEQVINGVYGNILRAKGSVQAGSQMFRFDVADGRYLITGTEKEEKGNVVFIGTEIERQKLRQFFYSRNKMRARSNTNGLQGNASDR